ncbi:hypothetical protein [Amycolatopsis taiwanensis]|uniref:Uncharacterized protein n=1 Tax=Amycolatopsis taiwanensis TaxID=342230 RepID=A0A9W6VER0_9PSEU|nr:hypothetical protein [Amycolatopsis taiwanensis]GLY64074.1 hypothetical protein Atai01_06930 [Amycolatopsis taiwanensis]
MTADDEELGRELRRLFDDARLDVLPREGAEEALVAGARRVRRRRAALTTAGGALSAVVLVVGSLLAGSLRPDSTQTASPAGPGPEPSMTSSVEPPVPSAPPMPNVTRSPVAQRTSTTPDPPQGSLSTTTVPGRDTSRPGQVSVLPGSVLGPTGYGLLQLGMSFQTAKATGMLAGASTPPTTCTTYTLKEGSYAVSTVYISPADGIVRFTAGGAHTPQGIEVGSTMAQLQVAYPGLSKSSVAYEASTGSGGSYVFYVDGHGLVTSIELIGPALTC